MSALLWVGVMFTAWAAPEDDRSIITDLGQIRAMNAVESEKALPVRAQAQVTFVDPISRELFLQEDDGDAISMYLPDDAPPLRRGQQIAIETTTSPGRFVSRLEDDGAQIQLLEPAPLPAGVALSRELLFSGDHDCRFGRVTGVIRRVSKQDHRWRVSLDSAFGTFPVTVRTADEDALWAMRGQRVEASGVLASRLDDKGRFVGPRMFSEDLSDLSLQAATPVIERSLDQMLIYDPALPTLLGLVRTRGVVMGRSIENHLFIHDGQTTALVFPLEEQDIKPGESIIVEGFPGQQGGWLLIRDAAIVERTPGPRPKAEPIRDASALRDPETNLRLVSVKFIVSDLASRGDELIVMGSLGKGDPIEIRTVASLAPGDLVVGATVRARGIVQQFETAFSQPWSIVVVDSERTLRVVRPPPLITTARIIRALWVLVAVLLIGVGVLALVRRQLNQAIDRRTAALQGALTRLDASEALRSALVRLATHDLASPLTVLRLQLDMAQGGLNVDEVKVLQKAVDNVEDTIQRRLREPLAQLDGMKQLPVRLDELAEQAIHSISAKFDGRRQKVVTKLQRVVAIADPGWVGTLILNLLDNASKYGPEGSAITVSTGTLRGRAFLRVRDEGPGVPENLKEAIFQGQGSGATPHPGEISQKKGLGLIRRVVQYMGGDIALENSDRGASFLVTLPTPKSDP
ncbi:MAG: ATP-binding protein [Myxococcota bacterium]